MLEVLEVAPHLFVDAAGAFPFLIDLAQEFALSRGGGAGLFPNYPSRRGDSHIPVVRIILTTGSKLVLLSTLD